MTADSSEKSVLKALRTAVNTACAGQPKTPPTAACLAAKQAVKDAQAADKATEDAAEKTSSTEKSAADQSEDKKEAAALKPVETAQHTACTTTTK